MTVLRTETVAVSHLLADLPDAPAERRQQYGAALIRALRLREPDPDFAATVAAGYVETPEQFAARINHTDARKEG